jgi:hypothetical protein
MVYAVSIAGDLRETMAVIRTKPFPENSHGRVARTDDLE